MIDLDDAVVDFAGHRALDGVSFCVHRGEFIGLIGPNGAGKTTLLRVMLGLQPVSGGLARLTPGARVGYVPQRGAVGDGQLPLSALEVVRLGKNDAAAGRAALREVGLETLAGRKYGELSGGQQQRVLIAKALVNEPDLIILDEPTTGIDEAAERDFFALLDHLAGKGLTVVMVSHDVEAIVAQVKRVICLNQRVLYDGPPAQFELETYLPQMYGTRHRALHHQHPHQEGDRHDD
ncbi:MAG TPA: metal ABC transporter ATP-binding protein [Candidatus Saccharimonadia bacterium]